VQQIPVIEKNVFTSLAGRSASLKKCQTKVKKGAARAGVSIRLGECSPEGGTYRQQTAEC